MAGIGNIELAPGAIVTWAAPTTLTLSAYHDISFLQGSKVANTGAGNLVLRADNTGTGSGTVNFLPARIGMCRKLRTSHDTERSERNSDLICKIRGERPSRPDPDPARRDHRSILPSSLVDFSGSTGTVSIFYNPSGGTTKYQNPTNYLCSGSCASGGVLTQAGSIDRLHAGEQCGVTCSASIPRYLCRTHTLLAGTSTQARCDPFRPVGVQRFRSTPFSTAKAIRYANLSIDATAKDVGLFAVIGSAGQVRNLNLTDVRVTASWVRLRRDACRRKPWHDQRRSCAAKHGHCSI